MSTGLTQRSNSSDDKTKVRPLQLSTNIIHTKIPKSVSSHHQNLKQSRSSEDPQDGNTLQPIKQGPKGLSVRNKNSNNNVAKPLKVSTNTIHRSQNKGPPLVKKVDENSVLSKATNEKAGEASTKPISNHDENDVNAYIKNSYNPLDDVYPLDEVLYEKILKLELADDGLPKFNTDEPFDF